MSTPVTCPEGHQLDGGSGEWLPCGCPSAVEAGTTGHRMWRCRECENAGARVVCYDPPHTWLMMPELASPARTPAAPSLA